MKPLSPIAINNVTPYVESEPVGVDMAIKGIQAALSSLSWLAKSFARAVIRSEVRDNAQYIYPGMFIAPGKDYLNMIGLDNWASYSFMVPRDPKTPVDYIEGISNTYTETVDLIVWANLQRVDNTREDDFIGELERDVRKKIESSQEAQFYENGEVQSVEVTNIHKEPENVFRGFTVNLAETQNLYFPYRGLRFELTCTYVEDCVT